MGVCVRSAVVEGGEAGDASGIVEGRFHFGTEKRSGFTISLPQFTFQPIAWIPEFRDPAISFEGP